MKHSKKKMYPGGGHFKKKANANMPKQQMKKGGKLKPVDAKKNPGLAKLPTDVRNKMGFMAMGGKMTDTDKDFMYGGKMKKMMFGGGFKKIAEKKDEMKKRFKSAIAAKFGSKKPKRKKKMMKGGKMNYPGGGMMKKGSMYPGGGRMQHD